MPIIQADHRAPWFAGASLRIDEEGARWSLFRKLGRIGERGAFEEAVAWTLENQPEPDEAKAYIRRFRLQRPRLAVPAQGGGRSLLRDPAACRFDRVIVLSTLTSHTISPTASLLACAWESSGRRRAAPGRQVPRSRA